MKNRKIMTGACLLLLCIGQNFLKAENVIVRSDDNTKDDPSLYEVPVTVEKDGDTLRIYSNEMIWNVSLNGEDCDVADTSATIDISDKSGTQTVVVETESGTYSGEFNAE